MEWFMDVTYTAEMIIATARMFVGLGVTLYGIKVTYSDHRRYKRNTTVNPYEGAALIAAGAFLMWKWV